jgi:hypothetical protein
MATRVGAGPLARIDGPPPVAPKYGLLQAARSSNVVRIVDDADERGIERWIGGATVQGWPVDPASAWDSCSVYSSAPPDPKEAGERPPLPGFDAFTIYLPISCTAYQVADIDAFRARAVSALGAVEGYAVEREFMGAGTIVMNPHLADGQGDFPNGNAATSIDNGLAVLEDYLSSFGKAGVIHLPPSIATAGGTDIFIDDGSSLRTYGGTAVVVGTGYADGGAPALHPDPGPGQAWIYATGPVDVRRSEVFTVPDTPAQALDRGNSGEDSIPNLLVYRAERYYLVVWDTAVQAAVLVDRCDDSC